MNLEAAIEQVLEKTADKLATNFEGDWDAMRTLAIIDIARSLRKVHASLEGVNYNMDNLAGAIRQSS
jgi:hypothetical protein